MRKLSAGILFVFSFLITLVAHSQTSTPIWFTLNAPEGSVITASAPITLRYGQLASTCAVTESSGPCNGMPVGSPTPETWTSPQTVSPPSGSSTVSVTVSNNTFGDPLPGVYKTAQIEEQANPQTITVNGQSVTVPGTSTSSPVWFTLNSPEGSVITASTPITLRYGQLASTCAVTESSGPCNGVPVGSPTPETWTSPQTFSPPSSSSTVSVTVSNNTFGDPLPGVYKTAQIEEQANPQTITVNGQSVTVPGTSTQSTCQLVANPSSISFQNTTVGYTLSSPASIVNNCPTTITVISIQISGPYSASGFQTPFSIGSGQTESYTAVFAPTTAGTANGTITFVSNATANGNLTISLTGTGVAVASTNHSVSLSWNGSGTSVAGYNVYRSTASGGPYTKTNNSLITSVNYVDQNVVSGTTYYYTVTAVGTNGVESGYSNEATVVVPSP